MKDKQLTGKFGYSYGMQNKDDKALAKKIFKHEFKFL